jgi:hypothetical protein
MDLNKLLSCHQVALIDMMEAPSRAARRWAGERADFYAGRIIALRKRLDLPIRPFDFRQQLA